MNTLAKKGIDCRVCGVHIPAGTRIMKQLVCTDLNTSTMTECEKLYRRELRLIIKKKTPKSIICDVCGETIYNPKSRQVRCNNESGTGLSECQLKGKNRIAMRHYGKKRIEMACEYCGTVIQNPHRFQKYCVNEDKAQSDCSKKAINMKTYARKEQKMLDFVAGDQHNPQEKGKKLVACLGPICNGEKKFMGSRDNRICPTCKTEQEHKSHNSRKNIIGQAGIKLMYYPRLIKTILQEVTYD